MTAAIGLSSVFRGLSKLSAQVSEQVPYSCRQGEDRSDTENLGDYTSMQGVHLHNRVHCPWIQPAKTLV